MTWNKKWPKFDAASEAVPLALALAPEVDTAGPDELVAAEALRVPPAVGALVLPVQVPAPVPEADTNEPGGLVEVAAPVVPVIGAVVPAALAAIAEEVPAVPAGTAAVVPGAVQADTVAEAHAAPVDIAEAEVPAAAEGRGLLSFDSCFCVSELLSFFC